MKQYVFILLAFFLFIFCDKKTDVTEPNTSLWQLTSFAAHRCPGDTPEKLEKVFDESGGTQYLNFWKYQNDTLLLDFSFGVTCFSAFDDSIKLEADRLAIFLNDTSNYHARCICNYKCQFRFFMPELSEILLDLNIKFFGSEGYEDCLDTLLKIQPKSLLTEY